MIIYLSRGNGVEPQLCSEPQNIIRVQYQASILRFIILAFSPWFWLEVITWVWQKLIDTYLPGSESSTINGM